MEFESLRAAGTSVRCVPRCAETGATLSTLPKPMVSETLRSRLCTAISDVGGLGREIDVRSYYHMSGMSSLLHILVYREASSHHQPNEKGGTAARDATIPKSCSPLNHLVARGVVGGMEGCPVCCSFRSCGRPLGSGCRTEGTHLGRGSERCLNPVSGGDSRENHAQPRSR